MCSFEIYDTVIFASHPNDEALGCTGMVHGKLKKEGKVKVVRQTNGDADTDYWEKLQSYRKTEGIEPERGDKKKEGKMPQKV